MCLGGAGTMPTTKRHLTGRMNRFVLVGIALVEQRGGREGVAAVGSTLGRIALAAVEMCITG